MTQYLKVYDIALVPLYIMLFYIIATIIQKRNIEEKPYYKYFRLGLIVKLFAGLSFCGIYLFYYQGGDTLAYFSGTKAMSNLMTKDVSSFFSIMFNNRTIENYLSFDNHTGFPPYYGNTSAFSVIRFSMPFYFLGMGSYLGTTLVLNFIMYFTIWKFYVLLNNIYPGDSKQLAIALFFFPSVILWSSGLLKDIYCLIAIFSLFTISHNIIFKRKKVLLNFFLMFFWFYVLISIRPFILYATIVGVLIWISSSNLKKIKSSIIRFVVFPFVFLIIAFLGSVIITQIGSSIGGRYSSFETMLETARVIQSDLIRDYYGTNMYDIGSFEPTFKGILSKAPQAITAGLFRPYLWEANNILMLFSGLENLILLIFALLVLIKMRFFNFFRIIFKDPFLLVSFVFSITYAFFVGLASANFGALVRYRIPLIPFFLIILFISLRKSKEEKC